MRAALGATNFINLTDTTNSQTASRGLTTRLGSGPDLTITADRTIIPGILKLSNVEASTGLSFVGGGGSTFLTQGATITLQSNVANTVLFNGGYNLDTTVRPYSGKNLLLAPDGGNVGSLLTLGFQSAVIQSSC